MKIAGVCLMSIVLGAAALVAQNASGDANSSSSNASGHPNSVVVAGAVTKDPGGDPVKKAVIELIAESQSEGGNYTALSASDGSFRIENIVPGRYRLFVERAGYRELDRHHRRSDGRVLTLTSGQELDDVMIRLQAAAVVEGRVTDEDGDPMPEAEVAVLRQTFVSGRSHFEQAGAERTNDLGEYRIAGLAAGNYFVSVTPPPDFRSLIEAAGNTPQPSSHVASDKPTPTSYQTTYYPGTRDRGQANAIPLHAGEDLPVDFSLTPSPSLTIRGAVVNVPAGASAVIMLQSKDLNLMVNGAEMHKDGSFEIRDVAPGAYTILATVDDVPVPMMARQSLQVTSANVEGLRLAPQTGGSVHGHLRMETSAGSAKPDPTQMFLLLRSADRDDESLHTFTFAESSRVAHVNGDGSFEWENLPPGRFFVQISESSAMPDWFLKAATAGGRDAIDSGFSVGGGTTTVDLVASANGVVADGVVTVQQHDSTKEETVSDAIVVAVPEARFRNHPDRYRKAVTDQRGRFTLRGLPPGDYTLFAWESVEGEAYYNPEFLSNYEGQGKALTLTEGERKSVQLKAIPALEDESQH